jgi:TPR repeat protein
MGQNNYQACLRHGTRDARDAVKVIEYFRMSVNQNQKNGLYNYARCLETGTGVGRDGVQDAKYYKKADDAGHAQVQAAYVRSTT